MSEKERLEEILGEFYDSVGDAPDLEELVRNHPDLEEEIRAHFSLLELVDRGFDLERSAEHGSRRPERIGDYRIVREIGRGGMGVVYEAEQTSMGRRVALKVLSPSVTSAAQAIQRFEREARAAGKLRHQNIAPVFAMGKDRGLHYYAMELVEGRSLGEVIAELKAEADEVPNRSGPFGTTTQGREHFVRLAEAIAGVAEALHSAHEEGVVHRDVKPTNLLLAPDGTLKLVDFGLARLAGEGASMTVTGQILGTPHYMSPEQAMARQIPIDFRTDIYSLGATLYEALTLMTPFTGDSLPAVCSAILHAEPALPRKANPRIPQDLETIVLKAMEKDRDRRYASAEEMAKDLRRFAVGMPIRARRIGPVTRGWRKVKRNKIRTGLVAAVLVLAVAGGLFAYRAAQEAERNRLAEYERLIAKSEEALGPSMIRLRSAESGGAAIDGQTPRDYLNLAVALLPECVDAWWRRALAAGATLDERLSDVDAARDRGLANGTCHLLRAFLLSSYGKAEEARAERGLAASHSGRSHLDLYVRGRLELQDYGWREARAIFSEVIDDPGAGRTLRFLARRRRAWLRFQMGDFRRALEDLLALREQGDVSQSTRIQTAAVWHRLEQPDEAERLFEELLQQLRMHGGPDDWRRLCEDCDRSHRPAWTTRAAWEGHDRHPGSTYLLFYRAVTLHRLGAEEVALAIVDGAIARDPDQHRFHAKRALMLDELWRPTETEAAFDRALELDPSCAPCLHARGLFLARRRRYAEALACFERSTALHPLNPVNHYYRSSQLAMLSKQRKDESLMHEALAAIDRCLELHPEHRGANFSRARTLVDLGRLREAVKALDRELALDNSWAAIHSDKARLLGELGHDEAAVESYRQAILHDPDWPMLHGNIASRLQKIGSYEDALKEYEEARKLDPEYLPALVGRAGVLSALGRVPEALQACDEVLERNSLNFETHCAKAGLLKAQGKFEEAVAAHREAIRINPEFSPSLIRLASLLYNTFQQSEEALGLIERALKLAPEDAMSWGMRGVILDTLEQYEEAHESFKTAARHGNERSEDFVIWGEMLAWTLQRPAQAHDILKRSVQLDPENARARYGLGVFLGERGRPHEALEELEESVRLDPSNADAIYSLGVCLGRLGRPDEALAAYEATLRLDPSYASAHFNRGAILQNVYWRSREALECFDEAFRLGQRDVTIYQNRAIVLEALGRYMEALVSLESALRHTPGSEKVHRLLALTLLAAGRPEDAYEVAERVAKINPHEHAYLKSRCLRQMGLLDEAEQCARTYVATLTAEPRGMRSAWLLAVAGERERAAKILGALEEPAMVQSHYLFARAHSLLGNTEMALRYLGQALEAGYRIPPNAPPDPDFASLEQNPRYLALLEKLRGK